MIGIRDRNEPNGYKTNSTTQKVDATLSSTSNNPPSNRAVTTKINELNNRGVYSEEEIVIGTWMDKPLYRKVVLLENVSIASSNTTSTVLATIPNVDKLLKMDGMAKSSNGLQFPLNTMAGSNYIRTWLSATKEVTFRNYIGVAVTEVNCILEYTKATD